MQRFIFNILVTAGVIISSSLQAWAEDKKNGDLSIKIANHFFKESGIYKPLSSGILFDRFSVVSVNSKGDYSFIKSSASNDQFRVFNAPTENTNIWASGIIGGSESKLPFIWMSKRIDCNFLSISYFYAWQVNLKISGIKDEFSNDLHYAILIPKPAVEINSLLFLTHAIESGSVSFTVIPGDYLLLIVKDQLIVNPLRFLLIEQREISVSNLNAEISNNVHIKINYLNLKASSYSIGDIVKSSPWVTFPNAINNDKSTIFEINSKSISAFNECK